MRPSSISVAGVLALALQCPVPAHSDEIARLLKQLKNGDADERAEAARDLGQKGAVEAVDALALALQDWDSVVRANAAVALGTLGDAARPAMPALRTALADESPYVVGNATWALDVLGVPPDELEGAYRRLLTEPDCVHRVRAVWGLVDQVPHPELFAAALDCSRNAEAFDDRKAAGDLLRRILEDDREMVPLVLEALERSGAADAADLARALADFRPPVLEAVPALVGLLSSSNADNRSAGARALGHMGPAALGTLPALSRALASDAEPEVREAAATAIGDLGRVAREAVPDLMEAAKDDPYPKVRQAAMDALGEMGGDAKAAIPMLRKALCDPDGFTRLAARNALFRIDPEHKEEAADAADATARAIQSAVVDLMTDATGVGQALAGKQAVEVILYRDFALATVPAGTGYEKLTYRGGTVTGPESASSTCDKVFRISDADFSLVPKMAQEAPGLVGAPGAPISHVVLGGGVFCGKASWLVYVGEGARSHGYVVFKLSGKVSKVQKF